MLVLEWLFEEGGVCGWHDTWLLGGGLVGRKWGVAGLFPSFSSLVQHLSQALCASLHVVNTWGIPTSLPACSWCSLRRLGSQSDLVPTCLYGDAQVNLAGLHEPLALPLSSSVATGVPAATSACAGPPLSCHPSAFRPPTPFHFSFEAFHLWLHSSSSLLALSFVVRAQTLGADLLAHALPPHGHCALHPSVSASMDGHVQCCGPFSPWCPITEALVFCSKPVACIRSHSLPLTSLGIAAPGIQIPVQSPHPGLLTQLPLSSHRNAFFPQKKFFIFILQPCRILTIMLLSSFPLHVASVLRSTLCPFLPPTCSSSKIWPWSTLPCNSCACAITIRKNSQPGSLVLPKIYNYKPQMATNPA